MYTLLDCIKHKCRDSYVLYILQYTPSVWYYLHTLFWYRHTHMTFPPPGCLLFSVPLTKRRIMKINKQQNPVIFKSLTYGKRCFWKKIKGWKKRNGCVYKNRRLSFFFLLLKIAEFFFSCISKFLHVVFWVLFVNIYHFNFAQAKI